MDRASGFRCFWFRLFAKAAAAGAAALCVGSAAQAGDDFIIGACTHFGQGKGILEENVSLLKQGGIKGIRDDISWNACEKEKGVLKMPESFSKFVGYSADQGLEPISLLLYANKLYDDGDYPRSPEAVEAFVRYSEFVVSSFKGKGKLYQVWNEWDGGCGMPAKYHGKGDPESYVKLLSAVYPRIKAVDPSITVVSNSVCTGDKYLKSLLELGMLKHCDVVALHTYNYGDVEPTPEKWLDRMTGVDKMLRSYNDGKEFPLFVTEMGWPTHIPGGGRSQAESADYIARLYLLAKTLPYIKGVWWYDFQDDGWDPNYNEDNFGMIRANLTPKKSYYVMKDLAPFINGSRFVERLDAGDPNVWALRFKAADGKDVIALWSCYKDDDWEIKLSSASGVSSKFSMCLLGEGTIERSFGARAWADKKPDFDPNSFLVTVRGRPCVLKGDLQDVKLASVAKRAFPEAMRPKARVVVVPEKIAAVNSVASGKEPKSYDFGDERSYNRVFEEPRKGRSDLDASFKMKYDMANLYLSVKVSDDVFVQDFSGAETWKGDGLQFAIQTLAKDYGDACDHSDFDVALTKDGPAVFRQFSSTQSQPGPAQEISAKATKEGSSVLYELVIPAKAVGLPALKPGLVFGFSLLVNDNDGKGRKGYLHWGDGIGMSKDPTKYNWISLED